MLCGRCGSASRNMLLGESPLHAARFGSAGGLDYTTPLGTGNGVAYGALATLREIRIGQLEIDDVTAVVMPNLDILLLGQTFLGRLGSYEMRDCALTLTW